MTAKRGARLFDRGWRAGSGLCAHALGKRAKGVMRISPECRFFRRAFRGVLNKSRFGFARMRSSARTSAMEVETRRVCKRAAGNGEARRDARERRIGDAEKKVYRTNPIPAQATAGPGFGGFDRLTLGGSDGCARRLRNGGGRFRKCPRMSGLGKKSGRLVGLRETKPNGGSE